MACDIIELTIDFISDTILLNWKKTYDNTA